MQLDLGKGWASVQVGNDADIGIIHMRQGDDAIVIPNSRLRHLIAKLEQFEKKGPTQR